MYSESVARKLSVLSSKIWLCLVMTAMMLLFAAISPAQSTFGEFVGTVKDPSGAVVVGCTVTIKNMGTSATRSATSDATGSYTVVNLEPGNYEITMEMAGFQKITFNNVQLTSRQTARIDGTMALASQAQAVEVNVQT